jgi:hypothetical protein
MRTQHPILLALLSTSLLAQAGTTPGSGGQTDPAVPAAFSPYGAGCPSSGYGYGNTIWLPASLAATFGGSNNNIPFSWTPSRYQQVFLGSETGGTAIIAGISLRQDNAFSNYDAQKIDMAMWLGGTTFDHTTLTTTYDSNFNSTNAPKVEVFKRRWYALPKMGPIPTNPNDILFTIPFDRPWPKILGNDNLLVEVKGYGNTAGNAIFTYPLDAGSPVNTTRLYAINNDPNAPTGTLGVNYGMVFGLNPIGSTFPAMPYIKNSNLPRLGRDFHIELLGTRVNAPGVLLIGASDVRSLGFTLPLALAPIGGGTCMLLASVEHIQIPILMDAGGDLAVTLPVPGDSALDGVNVYIQSVTRDTANALGLVLSHGGKVTMGSN